MPALTLTPDTPFNLGISLSCGQVFRWEDTGGGWWRGIVGSRRIRIRQDGPVLTFKGADREFITNYFHLDGDLPGILRSFDRDPVIHGAIECCRGLRIVRQPPWECLASYICATYANIPGIKRRISLICEQFGDRMEDREGEFFTFPAPSVIAAADVCEVRGCRLGYRSSYLLETARTVASDPGWQDRILALPYEEARRDLLRLRGVGEKVADCVLLFGFGKYEAFPVDVWIQRILQRCYKNGATLRSNGQIHRFGSDHFGKYAGYAQEYLFCNREGIMGRQVPSSQPER
ncbi:MAG: 8-oxoguanine DNA glycosylase [Methanolinea sp.]|nr:8-oxoguanine DNA glycosylase [Methanolinea sp.]